MRQSCLGGLPESWKPANNPPLEILQTVFIAHACWSSCWPPGTCVGALADCMLELATEEENSQVKFSRGVSSVQQPRTDF